MASRILRRVLKYATELGIASLIEPKRGGPQAKSSFERLRSR